LPAGLIQRYGQTLTAFASHDNVLSIGAYVMPSQLHHRGPAKAGVGDEKDDVLFLWPADRQYGLIFHVGQYPRIAGILPHLFDFYHRAGNIVQR